MSRRFGDNALDDDHPPLAGPLAQFGRSQIVIDLMDRLAAEFARRLEHSLEHGEEDQSSMETEFRPLALLAALLAQKFRSLFKKAR